MTFSLRRLLPAAVLAGAVLAASAAPASAASTYCSPTGDLCYEAIAKPPVRLSIVMMAEYFERFRLCVTGPDGERDCKRFRVREIDGGLWQRKVRWARHFPNRGRGVYRVRFFGLGNALGPPVTFSR